MRLNMTFRQRRQHLAWQRYQAARQTLFALCGAWDTRIPPKCQRGQRGRGRQR